MAIKHARFNGKPGYINDKGKIFTYDPNDAVARGQARRDAVAHETTEAVAKGSVVDLTSEVFDIQKYYDDEQLVFGWASVAKDKDGHRPIEWQGDEIEMYEMEPAVYDFVLEQGITKEMHRKESAKGQIVESVIFTKEKMAAMGIPEGVVPEGWWVGFKLEDRETFKKVKDGEYKMFSIEGKGVRTPLGGK